MDQTTTIAILLSFASVITWWCWLAPRNIKFCSCLISRSRDQRDSSLRESSLQQENTQQHYSMNHNVSNDDVSVDDHHLNVQADEEQVEQQEDDQELELELEESLQTKLKSLSMSERRRLIQHSIDSRQLDNTTEYLQTGSVSESLKLDQDEVVAMDKKKCNNIEASNTTGETVSNDDDDNNNNIIIINNKNIESLGTESNKTNIIPNESTDSMQQHATATAAATTTTTKQQRPPKIAPLSLPENLFCKETDECSICLEVYKVNDTISWSKLDVCHHIFHKQCISSWLETNHKCPLCRKPLLVLVLLLPLLVCDMNQESAPSSSSSSSTAPVVFALETEEQV